MNHVAHTPSKSVVLSGDKTLEELIEKFLKSHDVKEISVESYRRRLRDFTKWITDIPKVVFSRELLINYKRSLVSRRLQANTISAYLVAVRMFFEFLEASKLYPNIAKGIKGAKRERSFRKDPLTIPQIFRLLDSIDRTDLKGKRDFALLNLAIRTGPRSIEISRADIEDLRQEAGQAVLHLQGKGEDSKSAFVVLTEETLTPILEYLAERPNAKPDEPLFGSTSDGNRHERLSTRAIRRIAKERLRGVSIDSPRISTHSFRHTAVTLSLLAGATLQETQQMARHANIATTIIYAHNLQRAAGVPEKKIEELLRRDVAKGVKD
ncbi:MAG: tyrosine-type recombinase/integrase [Bdellovibrionaceae bacterium]|nr:tyrosine-type recombinase/integrase [Pseudobdellovibrionaceae bacterium]